MASAGPDLLVDISGIEELTEFNTNDRGVMIGAGVTIAALARNTAIGSNIAHWRKPPRRSPGPVTAKWGRLAAICASIPAASTTIKANGGGTPTHIASRTVGDVCHVAPQGQRCHAAFSGDLAPALLVLGAEIDIVGAQGVRRIPLGELYVEDGKAHLALADGELVVRRPLACKAAFVSLCKSARARGHRFSVGGRGGCVRGNRYTASVRSASR